MQDRNFGLSDQVIIEIVQGIKEIILDLIDRSFPRN